MDMVQTLPARIFMAKQGAGVVLGGLLITLTLAVPAAFALELTAADYHYPYHDPYLATATAALLHGRGKIAQGTIHDLSLTVLPQRDDIPLLKGKGRLRYRLYQHQGAAPLLFVIPGIGGSAYDGAASFVAELFADHGFHVITLPCPFSWNFALAASSSGYPGLTPADAKDLYAAMQLVLADVKRRYAIDVRNMGMIGLSDGALYAAFVSTLDAAQGKLGLRRTLLVNPPVDLVADIRIVDALASSGRRLTPLAKERLAGYVEVLIRRARRSNPFQASAYRHWTARLDLDDDALRYLIGSEIEASVGDVTYVSELVHHKRVFKIPVSWGHRSAPLKRARSEPVMDYVQRVLLPGLRETTGRPWSLDALEEKTSLRAIADSLQANQSVFLMHNWDDFLVSSADLAFLEGVFGERAILYPYGGHLGNLWYPANRRALLDLFRGLQQPELFLAWRHSRPLQSTPVTNGRE
jgi:acetyl esterase/lipase